MDTQKVTEENAVGVQGSEPIVMDGSEEQSAKPERRVEKTPEELMALQKEAEIIGRTVINPFVKGRKRSYYGQMEALIQLGTDEWHSFKAVRDKTKEILSQIKRKDGRSVWEEIAAEPCDSNGMIKGRRRSLTHPLSIDGRIRTNFRTLQRINKSDKSPYGNPLKQLCMSVDCKVVPLGGSKDEDLAMWYYMLNTSHKTPEDAVPVYDNPLATRGRKKGSKNKKAAKITPIEEK